MMCRIDGFQPDLTLGALVPLVVLAAARWEDNGPPQLSSGRGDDPRDRLLAPPPTSVGRFEPVKLLRRAGNPWVFFRVRKLDTGRGEPRYLLRNRRLLAE